MSTCKGFAGHLTAFPADFPILMCSCSRSVTCNIESFHILLYSVKHTMINDLSRQVIFYIV